MKRLLFLFLVIAFTIANAQNDRMFPPPGVTRSMPPMQPSMGPNRPMPTADRMDTSKYPYRLNYSGAQGSLELILKDYASQTGRTLLIEPQKVLPQVQKGGVYIESETGLNLVEYLQAIERVLRMHNIALIEVGERFLKAVPLEEARKDGMKIDDETDGFLTEEGKWVSQFISLKHISVDEAELSIKEFVRTGSGKIIKFETSNSLLVTDTQDNINRVIQILKRVDQPIEVREETNVRVIKHVKASEIKKHIDALVSASKEDEKTKKTTAVPKNSGSPGVTRKNIPGVIRTPTPIPTASYTSTDDTISVAERGIIRGKVQVIADDRTGTLIIITRPENMKFFDKIIDVLDVSSDPDVIVKVIPLNYADVEEIEKMINDLIGAQKKSSDKDRASVTPGAAESEGSKSTALNEFVKRRQEMTESAVAKAGPAKVGELSSENIKILANKRTNALIVMASKRDMNTIEQLVNSMDMKLSQVLIEAVILEIGLDEGTQSGVDWVQRSLIAFEEDGSGVKDPISAFAGGAGGGQLTPLDTLSLTETAGLAASLPTGGGLSYYFTHFGLNVDAIISMAASDSKTEIVSKPVIVTHENEEAKIESSQDRYFYKGKRWVSTGTSSGTYEDDVDLKSITTSLTVTPHINEEKMVEMEIVQKIEELGPSQSIGDNEWPTTLKREMSARVAVRTGETIILGGFVKHEKTSTSKGIPYLKDIPLVGWLFGYEQNSMGRSELVVFMTPYVMDTDEDILAESKRRRDALEAGDLWERDGWSNSNLANPTKEDLEKQKQAEKEAERNAEEVEKARQEYSKDPDKGGKKKSRKGVIPFIRTKPYEGEEMAPPAEKSAPKEVSSALDTEGKAKSEDDTVSSLDPELAEYIKRQQKQMEEILQSVDKKVEKDMK